MAKKHEEEHEEQEFNWIPFLFLLMFILVALIPITLAVMKFGFKVPMPWEQGVRKKVAKAPPPRIRHRVRKVRRKRKRRYRPRRRRSRRPRRITRAIMPQFNKIYDRYSQRLRTHFGLQRIKSPRETRGAPYYSFDIRIVIDKFRSGGMSWDPFSSHRSQAAQMLYSPSHFPDPMGHISIGKYTFAIRTSIDTYRVRLRTKQAFPFRRHDKIKLFLVDFDGHRMAHNQICGKVINPGRRFPHFSTRCGRSLWTISFHPIR